MSDDDAREQEITYLLALLAADLIQRNPGAHILACLAADYGVRPKEALERARRGCVALLPADTHVGL